MQHEDKKMKFFTIKNGVKKEFETGHEAFISMEKVVVPEGETEETILKIAVSRAEFGQGICLFCEDDTHIAFGAIMEG